ncbi:MAG: hypothetical protein ACOYN0_00915 [Phycisphaerales bacterium]
MGIIARLFGNGSDPGSEQGSEEHAVIVRVTLEGEMPTDEELERFVAIQERLAEAINAAGSGEFDGDEWGEGVCTIYMYGPDADALWESVMKVLEREPFRAGSTARKRYGPPGAREEVINLRFDG